MYKEFTILETKRYNNLNEATKKGIQALLRDRIIQGYNYQIERGYCPIYALENIDALYKEYKALGGNGAIPTLVEELHELPHKLQVAGGAYGGEEKDKN